MGSTEVVPKTGRLVNSTLTTLNLEEPWVIYPKDLFDSLTIYTPNLEFLNTQSMFTWLDEIDIVIKKLYTRIFVDLVYKTIHRNQELGGFSPMHVLYGDPLTPSDKVELGFVSLDKKGVDECLERGDLVFILGNHSYVRMTDNAEPDAVDE